jgi:molybdopterin/thiamine biosynthesis adenylyltransferase
MLGTMQALQAIKVILNLGEQLIGKLMTVDALDLNFRTLQINNIFGTSIWCVETKCESIAMM